MDLKKYFEDKGVDFNSRDNKKNLELCNEFVKEALGGIPGGWKLGKGSFSSDYYTNLLTNGSANISIEFLLDDGIFDLEAYVEAGNNEEIVGHKSGKGIFSKVLKSEIKKLMKLLKDLNESFVVNLIKVSDPGTIINLEEGCYVLKSKGLKKAVLINESGDKKLLDLKG